MSLSELASIGSFVSGFAVIVSFVFLALQIRQSNLNQRSLMRQARTAQMLDIYMKMSEPYASDLMVRSEAGDETMDAPSIQSYFRIMGAWFRQYENNYHQFLTGTLDPASWDGDLAAITYLLRSPAVRTAWRTERLIMGSNKFRDLVDGVMDRNAPTAETFDYRKVWTKRLAEEMGHRAGDGA